MCAPELCVGRVQNDTHNPVTVRSYVDSLIESRDRRSTKERKWRKGSLQIKMNIKKNV